MKENWWFHTRLLGLEKIKCVKCSWKLTYKNAKDYDSNYITLKCPCCGYTFTLQHDDGMGGEY